MERLQEALAKSDNSDRVADLEQALAAANERVREAPETDAGLRDQLIEARENVKAVLARADNAEKRAAEASEAHVRRQQNAPRPPRLWSRRLSGARSTR